MTVSTLVDPILQELAIEVDSNTHIDNFLLAANVPKSITKPSGAKYAMISADGGFFADYDATANTGGTDFADGTGSEYIGGWLPAHRQVGKVTTISVAATAARKISVVWKI